MNADARPQRKISQETLIPVGMVVTAIIILVGGILWLTEIRSIASQNQGKIVGIENSLDNLRTVDQRLSRIEGRLQVIYDIIKEEKRH